MGKLAKKVTHAFDWVGEKAGNLWHDAVEGSKQIAEKLGYQGAGVTPKSDKTLKAEAPPPAVPLPDEETLRRERRKRLASAASTGRASTILTNEDSLGG